MASDVVLHRGRLQVTIACEPFGLELRRAGVRLVHGVRPWCAEGEVRDSFVQLTEGVIAKEERETRRHLERAEVRDAGEDWVALRGSMGDSRELDVRVEVAAERVIVTLSALPAPLRHGLDWERSAGESFTGLGARHCEVVDQAGRHIRLGADRRYTGPDCPADMLEVGGIPQGDYVPVPWLLASRGYALWIDNGGDGVELDLGARVSVSHRAAAGAFRCHMLTDPSPAAQLRRYLRMTGLPGLLPEWGYGHWKSRDVYEHQRDVEEDFDGYRDHDLALDAIVIDSPWETQYNTWTFNPHQFPDPKAMLERFRAGGVRTVVWVTPWINLESAEGQRPPDAESERLHREPAPNYEEAARAGHFVRAADGGAFVARWWMGTGSPIDFTSAAADAWWREQARPVLELGVEVIKADDGEGYYFPADLGFADGRSGAEAAWAYGGLYRRSMQRALDDAHPGEGVLFGRSGWTGQQAVGFTWGGDQASDFWSLRALVAATITAAASGYSNWSHDVGGYLGERLVDRCPSKLLLRWAWFGCFTPLMQAHGRFPQEAWSYDSETLDVYRQAVRPTSASCPTCARPRRRRHAAACRSCARCA